MQIYSCSNIPELSNCDKQVSCNPEEKNVIETCKKECERECGLYWVTVGSTCGKPQTMPQYRASNQAYSTNDWKNR